MKEYKVYVPNLNGNEFNYVSDCIKTSWISSKGKYVEQFEKQFSNYIGGDYGVGTFNGTVALHLALTALGIGPDDEVICPTFTYVASANVIRYCGAAPVFVDSADDTWQMDPKLIEEKISPRTKAILVVHLYGQSADMDQIMTIARKYGLKVVEDCAEAIGTEFHSKKVGSFGDIGCFSFYGNKTITCGEGGMCITKDPVLYQRMKHYRGQGVCADKEYWHDVIGFNYRMTNIQAAIGMAQFERINLFIDKKRKLNEMYRNHLGGLPITFHLEQPGTKHTFWMNSFLVHNERERDLLRQYMRNNGIETRPLFYPLHLMPMYYDAKLKFPVAENISLRGINIPSYPDLSEDDVVNISKVIKGFFHAQN